MVDCTHKARVQLVSRLAQGKSCVRSRALAEGDEDQLLSREHLRGEQTGVIPPCLIKEPEQGRASRLERGAVE